MEFHEPLVRATFKREIAEKIIASGRLAFHRHQLLYVAQEALRFCTNNGNPVELRELGSLFLMASDQLHIARPEPTNDADKLLHLLSMLLPTCEANSYASFLLKMGRSSLMLAKFVEPLRQRGNFFDVPALFEKATGVPLEIYQALLFGTLARFAKLADQGLSADPRDCTIPYTWFRTTTVSASHLQAFVSDVSSTTQGFVAGLNERNPSSNDFTLFRDKPLLLEPDCMFPIDYTFLGEKFDTGPFWRIHNNCLMGKNEKNNFHSFWGHVFEGYMNWLLDLSCRGKANKFYPDPRYANNPTEQVCDALIVCDRTAILLEYKGSTFTSPAKYGEDIAILKKELEEKLIGTPTVRKGVQQLAHAVERLCRYENPDSIQGVDLSNVSTIFPVVITRDDLGSAFCMNAYLNLRFQELKPATKGLRRSVTPLFCLSANDIEKISPYLPDTRLSAMLEARYKNDKPLTKSFWIADNSVIEKKGARQPTILREALTGFGHRCVEILGIVPGPNEASFTI